MRNRVADEFERYLRSPACSDRTHDDCWHWFGFGYGGLNLRRLRLESGMLLCKCECHSSCPVTGERMLFPEKAWRELCTCAGAEEARGTMDQLGVEFPDFSEVKARVQRESRARKEAQETVRARAIGMSRDQIKDLYRAELSARELNVPSDAILDRDVSLMVGDYLAAARFCGQAVGDLARHLAEAFRPPPLR